MSDVKISEEAKSWISNLARPLKDFYTSIGRHLDKDDLYLEIERRFGDQILRELCIPRGLSLGACLIIARAVAEE